MTGLFDNGLILNDTLFTSFPASLGYSFETVEVDTVNQSVQIPNYNPVYHYIIIFDNSIYFFSSKIVPILSNKTSDFSSTFSIFKRLIIISL